MQASAVVTRCLDKVVMACALAALAGCAADHPTALTGYPRAPSTSIQTGVCGGGGEPDPHPEAPGIFLCSTLTADFCFSGANTDIDQDGLADFCETQLSFAFRPELRYSTWEDDIRGEPYWVARRDSSGHVLIGYLFSYYRDLGSVQFGCTPPAKLAKSWGCHNGDSESIWLLIGYNAATLHWVLQGADYSAHDDFNESAYNTLGGYADVQYPIPIGGGYPRVWIAEKKHANYFSQEGCNYANFQWGMAWDWCADDDASMRMAWSDYWNIGSESHPYVNSVASRDPSYEYYGGGRTECYWTEKRFRGWVPDDIGGWDASSYLGKLIRFGFATTGVTSCVSPPPPPPPAALSATIAADPPYYTASPYGGSPPYTYLWEACAIDCVGGDAGPLARVAQPNTVAHGWQTISTALRIYWTSTQWTLRLTVTDVAGGQAQAEYYVP